MFPPQSFLPNSLMPSSYRWHGQDKTLMSWPWFTISKTR